VPKGKGPGTDAPNSPVADGVSSAERRDLTHSGTCTERGKPKVPPVRAGRRAARDADGTVGKGRWKKRKSPCNGVNRDRDEKTSTLSHAKAGRLPILVARHEKA